MKHFISILFILVQTVFSFAGQNQTYSDTGILMENEKNLFKPILIGETGFCTLSRSNQNSIIVSYFDTSLELKSKWIIQNDRINQIEEVHYNPDLNKLFIITSGILSIWTIDLNQKEVKQCVLEDGLYLDFKNAIYHKNHIRIVAYLPFHGLNLISYNISENTKKIDIPYNSRKFYLLDVQDYSEDNVQIKYITKLSDKIDFKFVIFNCNTLQKTNPISFLGSDTAKLISGLHVTELGPDSLFFAGELRQERLYYSATVKHFFCLRIHGRTKFFTIVDVPVVIKSDANLTSTSYRKFYIDVPKDHGVLRCKGLDAKFHDGFWYIPIIPFIPKLESQTTVFNNGLASNHSDYKQTTMSISRESHTNFRLFTSGYCAKISIDGSSVEIQTTPELNIAELLKKENDRLLHTVFHELWMPDETIRTYTLQFPNFQFNLYQRKVDENTMTYKKIMLDRK